MRRPVWKCWSADPARVRWPTCQPRDWNCCWHNCAPKQRRYDVVLLDLSAGIDRTVRRIAAWSDRLLVVATDEPTSLTDAYAVLKLQTADRPDGDARIVVNQAQSTAAGQQTYATLRRACAAFLHREPPLAGVIRHDPKVRDALRRQTPLLLRHPNSVAAQDVEALARASMMDWRREE